MSGSWRIALNKGRRSLTPVAEAKNSLPGLPLWVLFTFNDKIKFYDGTKFVQD